MDFQADFAAMFAEGDDIIIAGISLKGFFVQPGIIEEPYYGNERDGDGTYALVQQNDLEGIGQWPVSDPVVEVNGITYRVIRPHRSAGHVQLFLQEA